MRQLTYRLLGLYLFILFYWAQLSVSLTQSCPCGAQVDVYDVHSLACERVSGKITRHQALNDVIVSRLAGYEGAERPLNIRQQKPDGLTLLPWTANVCTELHRHTLPMNLVDLLIRRPITLYIYGQL